MLWIAPLSPRHRARLPSVGPAVPALRTTDPAELRAEVLAALDGCRDERGTYRFRNDHRFVVAARPA